MSKFIIVPANDYVIAVDHPKNVVIDGIEMPDNVRQQEMVFGTVVYVGPQVSPDTKPEDQICYGPWAGKLAVLNGTLFRILREGQIELYLRKTN